MSRSAGNFDALTTSNNPTLEHWTNWVPDKRHVAMCSHFYTALSYSWDGSPLVSQDDSCRSEEWWWYRVCECKNEDKESASMNVFLVQMKSQRFSRNDNLTVNPADLLSAGITTELFLNSLSHILVSKATPSSELNNFHFSSALKYFPRASVNHRQQTQHNCYLLFSELYSPHYSFIQWLLYTENYLLMNLE